MSDTSGPERPRGPGLVMAGPLRGTPVRIDDLPDLEELLTDPLVVPTLTATGEPLSGREIAARLEAHLWHWSEHGFGAWIFRDAGGSFVARGALERRLVDDRDEVELMYAVASAHWGRGHGKRVARALVDVAFGPLGLQSVVAFALPSNEPSRRILLGCGFSCDGRVEHAGLPHDLFRLPRSGSPPTP